MLLFRDLQSSVLEFLKDICYLIKSVFQAEEKFDHKDKAGYSSTLQT